MSKKVLGKGLAALIPEKRISPPETESEILAKPQKNIQKAEGIAYLKTSEINPNRYQPRKDFDINKLGELISSIKEKGVVQPILVRRTAGEKYELIAGERRLRAVESLGIKEIPAIVKEVGDLDSLELSLIENIQREDLNPIEEADAYQMLVDRFRFTQERIAEAVGKNRTSVANSLRLLELPQKIQEALKNGALSMGHGRALLGLEGTPARMEVCKKIISKGLSVREVENIVRARRLTREKKTLLTPARKDYHLMTIEEELQRILGTRVKIIKGKKRGKIEIEYYSDTDLERIINRLSNK